MYIVFQCVCGFRLLVMQVAFLLTIMLASMINMAIIVTKCMLLTLPHTFQSHQTVHVHIHTYMHAYMRHTHACTVTLTGHSTCTCTRTCRATLRYSRIAGIALWSLCGWLFPTFRGSSGYLYGPRASNYATFSIFNLDFLLLFIRST